MPILTDEQITVDTISQLSQSVKHPFEDFDGRVVFVKGSRGGPFAYDFSSTDTDDGGCTIDGPNAIGRFKRQFTGEIKLKWFGVVGDGLNDETDAINKAADAARAEKLDLVDDGNQQAQYLITNRINLTDINVRIGGEIRVDDAYAGIAVEAGGFTDIYEGSTCELKVYRKNDNHKWGDGSVGIKIKRGRKSTFRLKVQGFETGVLIKPTDSTEANLLFACRFDICEVNHCRVGWHIWTLDDTYVNANYWTGGGVVIGEVPTLSPSVQEGSQIGWLFQRDDTSDIANNIFDSVNCDSAHLDSQPVPQPVGVHAGAVMFECTGNASAAFTVLNFQNMRMEVGVVTHATLIKVHKLTSIDFEYESFSGMSWHVQEEGVDNYIQVRKKSIPTETYVAGTQFGITDNDTVHFKDARTFSVITGKEQFGVNDGNPSLDDKGNLSYTASFIGPGHVFRKDDDRREAFFRTNLRQLIALAWDGVEDTATSLDFNDAGPDTITRDSMDGSFIDDGFLVGQQVMVTNASNPANNKAHHVTAVSATTLTLDTDVTADTGDTTANISQLISPITLTDDALTDDIPPEPEVINGVPTSAYGTLTFAATTPPTITRTTGSWLVDGFRDGGVNEGQGGTHEAPSPTGREKPRQQIEITYSSGGLNEGIHTIAKGAGSVTEFVLTLKEGSRIVAESTTAATVNLYGEIGGRETQPWFLGWRFKGDWAYISPRVDRFWMAFAPWGFAETFRELTLTSQGENRVLKEPFGANNEQTFIDGDTSPDVSLGKTFITANTGSTNINDFDNAEDGRLFTVWINDVNTSLSASSTLELDGGNWTAGNTGFFLFERRGAKVYEIARSVQGAGGGGGDVTKVGTPVNDQIGVWTGDGTLEGDPNFTWNITDLELLRPDNDGNPGIKIGASATERLRIRTFYKAGTQVLNNVTFLTETGETGTDDGAFVFQVDASEELRVNRDGVRVIGTFEPIGDIISNSNATIELSPDNLGRVKVNKSDAVTNSVSESFEINHVSSGTPAAGFGSSLVFRLESSTTEDATCGQIKALWNEATHATRKADVVFSVHDTSEREAIRLRGGGSAAQIGFYGATPVSRHSATGETAGFTAGSGTAANDDSTYTGNVGATAYTVGDVVKALKNLGIMNQ